MGIRGENISHTYTGTSGTKGNKLAIRIIEQFLSITHKFSGKDIGGKGKK